MKRAPETGAPGAPRAGDRREADPRRTELAHRLVGCRAAELQRRVLLATACSQSDDSAQERHDSDLLVIHSTTSA